MSLSSKQQEFAEMINELLTFAFENGYRVTFGDAYRDPKVHGEYGEKKSYAAANSEHKRRLAMDINIFRGNKYLTSTEDHRPLGEYWEKQLGGKWGGNFKTPDGNHYEYGEI